MAHPLRRIVSAIPFKFMIGMTLALAFIQEWYPFSHFPMYSSFEDYTYYVFVTDAQDRPIAVETVYGIRSSVLKKVYHRELRKLAKDHPTGTKGLPIEQRFPAGAYTLKFLQENSGQPPEEESDSPKLKKLPLRNAPSVELERPQHLKLFQVEIRGEKTRITQETHLVGSI